MPLTKAFITLLYSVLGVVFINGQTVGRWENSDNYYCNDPFTCSYDRPLKNILCGNDLKLNSSEPCTQGESYVYMNDELKEALLNGHNEKRSLVAQGKLDGVFLGKTATKMATLVWDDELELMAVAKGLQCIPTSVECMQTDRFPVPGRSTASFKISGILPAINKTIDSWFNHHKFVTNFEWMELLLVDQYAPWHTILPFTQIILSNAVAIGCSMFKNETFHHVYCVYSAENEGGAAVYEVGEMGSKCVMGLNPKYTGLCITANTSTESPIVKKWIHTGKPINGNIWKEPLQNNDNTRKQLKNAGASDKLVDSFTQTIILALNIAIVKMFIL